MLDFFSSCWYNDLTFGDVPKRLKGADSKSARRRKTCGGSNPSISAITGHLFWYHGYWNGCPVSFYFLLICKGFSIRFNETRLCGDVRSSPQSLVLFYRGIPFNERSEVCPLLGKVCSKWNPSEIYVSEGFLRRLVLLEYNITNQLIIPHFFSAASWTATLRRSTTGQRNCLIGWWSNWLKRKASPSS